MLMGYDNSAIINEPVELQMMLDFEDQEADVNDYEPGEDDFQYDLEWEGEDVEPQPMVLSPEEHKEFLMADLDDIVNDLLTFMTGEEILARVAELLIEDAQTSVDPQEMN